MKRILFIFIGLAVAASLMWAGAAMAANVRSGDSPRVMENETIDGTLYAAGNKIRIDGTVQGDVICGAQELEINGVIEGDVICAAQKITISGEVQGDIRVAGQEVTIEGVTAGSVSIAGQDITTTPESAIAKDVTILGSKATLDGSIGRDAQVMAEVFSANLSLTRHLEVTAQTVKLGEKTQVGGNFIYTSAADASIATEARIAGETEHKIPETNEPNPQTYLGVMLLSLTSFAVLGGALLLAVPRFLHATAQAIQKAPLLTVAAGFAGLVLPPFVGAILLLSGVGTPLAIAVLLVWCLSLLCGLVVSAQALGQAILRKSGWHAFIALLIGLGALFLLGLLPFAGGFVLLAAVIWGVGAQWYTAVSRRTIAKKATKEL